VPLPFGAFRRKDYTISRLRQIYSAMCISPFLPTRQQLLLLDLLFDLACLFNHILLGSFSLRTLHRHKLRFSVFQNPRNLFCPPKPVFLDLLSLGSNIFECCSPGTADFRGASSSAAADVWGGGWVGYQPRVFWFNCNQSAFETGNRSYSAGIGRSTYRTS
jgi:hypothetical protein